MESVKMKRLLKYLLFVVFCTMCLWGKQVNAADTSEVQVELTGVKDVKIYTDKGGQEISVVDDKFSALPGCYYYECFRKDDDGSENGRGGYFSVTADTTELKLASVSFYQVSPTRYENGKWLRLDKLGTLKLYDEEGKEYEHATDNVYNFLVPQKDGDSYYTYTFTPFDEEYLPIEGHFYVYQNTYFESLNLSDSGRIPYLKKSYITVKAPAGMEIYTVWQLKYYTAWNWKSYKPEKSKDGYNYYTVPEGFTYMLKQEGKVTWYGKSLRGEWNKPHTEVTLSDLEENSTQVHREQAQDAIYASMLTNLPESCEVDLQVGEYFDLVPLRACQAVRDLGSNVYNDPEWHYKVIGGSESVASVEITKKDDKIGQFGRIHANGEGTVLIAFYYDAMQAMAYNGTEENYVYSALWPELTGIAVVHVSKNGAAEPQTKITSNIGLSEESVVYYQKSQTGIDGIRYGIEDHAEYTFTPGAETNGRKEQITSVRVHSPIMVTDGELSENPTNWLTDGSWKSYQAGEDGSYTLHLSEGRNIVEIKAGDAVIYHVILARGLDVTIGNQTSPGQSLKNRDTAKITLENLIPPLYKMGAIYNPAGVDYKCKTDGVAYTAQFGQYMASTSFYVKLQKEETGSYTISDGILTVEGWGAGNRLHKKLTRNSMAGYGWSGGDNPKIDYGTLAYLPDITFEVSADEDTEEIVYRSSGNLKALNTYPNSNVSAGGGARFTTARTTITQNFNVNVPPMSTKIDMGVGAALVNEDEDATLLVRYWFGDDSSKAMVRTNIPFQKVENDTNLYGAATVKIGRYLLEGTKNKINANVPMNLEVIVIPADGAPVTYATYIRETRTKKPAYLPANLIISAAEGSEKLGRWDGVLEADNITYLDENGSEVTQDLGYGFIGTESHFTTSVPNGTDQIVLTADGKYGKKNVGESLEIIVNGTKYSEKDAIPLKVGVNELNVTYTPTKGTSRTYTIDVTRRTESKKVAFSVPDGASVLVMQKSKAMTAAEDGTYTLENGTYSYYVSKPGYLTASDSFTVSDENPNQTITVESLTPVEQQSGTVSVQLAGQNIVFCPTTSMDIPEEAEDLTANKYVQYNHGGYTVLHALIDASRKSGTSFSCYKGAFTLDDENTGDSNGKKAAWVCKVNGNVCKDPANTLVKEGDKIEFFYSSGWNGMEHARLTKEKAEVKRGDTITLTLTGTGIYGTDAEAIPVAQADIYEGSKLLGQTDSDGSLTLEANAMSLGTHYLTAEKKDADGHNLLTAVMSTVTVKKTENPDADPNKTTVTFRLIGDTKHENGNEGAHQYTTWLATSEYTFDKPEVTAGEVFKEALDGAGLKYEGLEKNYISSITAPEVCGGYVLSEKDNGKNSGWMYTVNGVHPSEGVNNWYVSNGDEIVFHYVDDYTVEQADMIGDEGSGSSGNVSTWNKWLEALDETPGAREHAAAAEKLIALIEDEITLDESCEASITAAREAYDALTREEKGYVTNYQTLTDAEAALKDLKDQKAAKDVEKLIEELKDAQDLTLDDQDAVTAARTAYSSLTDDQKSYVSNENLGKLEHAEEQIAKLLEEAAVGQVIAEIGDLPSKEEVTLEDKTAIETALAHYEALSEEQKNDMELNAADSLTKLHDVIERLNVLIQQNAVEEVNKKLNDLPAADEILFVDQTAIEEAREAYEALDDLKENLKDQVSAEALAKLVAAEERLNTLQEEVNHVAELIDALPPVDDLTVDHADQVQAAREAYNALNNDQKHQLTDSGVLSELLMAENQMSWLMKDAEAAKKVTDRINSLPTVKDLRLSDKAAVEAARYAYDYLSDEQKPYVSEDTLKALEEREAEIKRLEEVTPTPTPNPSPTPSDDPKQDEDEDSITLTYQNYPISVTGQLSGYELRLTALKADDDVVKQMQNMISSKEALIRLYDVALYKDGKEVEWNDKLTVNFQVGTSYNGQTLSVLHEGNGKIETLSGTVSNGILSVTANSTGSFGVVVPASTVSTGNGSSNNGGSAGTVTNGNLGGGSTGTGNGTTAVSGTGKVTSAKTGDDTDILFPIAGLITATGVLAGVVLYYKKKKRITGVQTEEE